MAKGRIINTIPMTADQCSRWRLTFTIGKRTIEAIRAILDSTISDNVQREETLWTEIRAVAGIPQDSEKLVELNWIQRVIVVREPDSE